MEANNITIKQQLSRKELLSQGLTVKERISLWKHVLDDLKKGKSNTQHGICLIIWYYFSRLRSTDVLNLFPEFAIYKPKKLIHGSYWFDNNVERIEVVKQIINKLQNEKEKI